MKDTFDAADEQIIRDHLVSHVLAALSSAMPDRVLFYGGTALSRTILPQGRLSEDIDLIAVGPWTDVAQSLARILTQQLSREFGRPVFEPEIDALRPRQPCAVRFPTGSTIQIQIMPESHYPAWPCERRSLEQRYADVMPASLVVPTRDSFIAWKSVTYLDRRTPRDLWDLAALAGEGGFTPQAGALFAKFGPFTALPSLTTIPKAPSEEIWVRDLGHQTRLRLTAAQAHEVVVRAWSEVSRRP